ncbi:MAG: serine/threonine protein kinase, partial [Acidimicrobiia bacterium]|nr:serine/threonine protein kinase [Acidimicrobiia bacterium]
MGVEPTPGQASGHPPDQTVKLDRAIVLRPPSFPARFGRYHVTARIGVGGFATVYSALDPGLDAAVAIKVLAENHAADVEVRRRFVAEARVARKVGSERLIGVFDIGETDDGRPYVVMELADGGTLRSRINRLAGPADRAALTGLVNELGACMEAIHARGVVHRDIKPTNLLLRADGPV